MKLQDKTNLIKAWGFEGKGSGLFVRNTPIVGYVEHWEWNNPDVITMFNRGIQETTFTIDWKLFQKEIAQ